MARLRVVPFIAVFFGLAVPANATSLIIDVETNRVIIIADSRARELNASGNPAHDNQCKIVPLGKTIAFTETGSEGYTPSTSGDDLREWHGTAEALNAYNDVPDHDLYQVALAWSIRVTNNFQLFYLNNPKRVRSLATKGVLLLGFFAGTDPDGKLKVYVGRAAIDDTLQSREGASVPVGRAVDPFPVRGEPISTNSMTQELLDGKTDRAKKIAKTWAKKSRGIPPGEKQLRRLEYMVERTGDYDPDVHSPINVMAVTPNSTEWIQNVTCRSR